MDRVIISVDDVKGVGQSLQDAIQEFVLALNLLLGLFPLSDLLTELSVMFFSDEKLLPFAGQIFNQHQY